MGKREKEGEWERMAQRHIKKQREIIKQQAQKVSFRRYHLFLLEMEYIENHAATVCTVSCEIKPVIKKISPAAVSSRSYLGFFSPVLSPCSQTAQAQAHFKVFKLCFNQSPNLLVLPTSDMYHKVFLSANREKKIIDRHLVLSQIDTPF